jgi:O-antigen/teichoic acid export membrane protein
MRTGTRDLFALTLAGVSKPAAALFAGPLLARVLGPEGRGELAGLTMPFLLFPVIFVFGLPQAAAYFAARRGVRTAGFVRATAPVLALLSVACTGALVAFAYLVFGDAPHLRTPMVLAAFVTPPVLIIHIARGVAKGAALTTPLVAEEYSRSFGRLALLVLLALAGMLTVGSAFAVTVGSTLVAGALLWRFPRLIGRAEPAPPGLGREALRYGRSAWVAGVANHANARLDQVVMIPLAGAVQLGYYAAAVSLTQVVSIAVVALGNTLFPRASTRQDPQLVARVCRITLPAALGVAVVGGALAHPVTVLLFGHEFAPAAAVLRVLLFAAVMAGLAFLWGSGLAALGMPRSQAIAQVAGLVVTVVGVGVVVPVYGAMGAAWVSLASHLLAVVVSLRFFVRATSCTVRECLLPRTADVAWGLDLLRGTRRSERQ